MKIGTELIYRFFNRDTTPDEEIKIRKWLEESDEHYREFLAERKLFDAILLHGKSGNAENGRKKSAGISWKKFFLRTAGVAAVSWLIVMVTTAHWERAMRKEGMNHVEVPQGQRVNIALADGTNVWLNAKTKMEYPQSFRVFDKRVVKVDGEAYFEVAKNPDVPFVVETTKGRIEVLGTKFYVSDYSTTDKFETSLMEGSVTVCVSNTKLTLLPNDKAVLRNGRLVREKIGDMDAYRWRDGLYCFKDLDFLDVLKQFEVYYDVRFIQESKNDFNSRISGKFRLVDGVDYALRVLQKEVNFTYRRDNETNVIYLK